MKRKKNFKTRSNNIYRTESGWRVRRVNNMATLGVVLYGDQWKHYWNAAK